MQLSYSSGGSATTWTLANADLPDIPVGQAPIQTGGIRRNWGGTGRQHVSYSKFAYSFNWTGCGTVVKNHLASIALGTGTVLLSDTDMGTMSLLYRANSHTLDWSGYTRWDAGIVLEQL